MLMFQYQCEHEPVLFMWSCVIKVRKGVLPSLWRVGFMEVEGSGITGLDEIWESNLLLLLTNAWQLIRKTKTHARKCGFPLLSLIE